MSHTMTYNNEIERLKIVRYICKIRVYFITVAKKHPVYIVYDIVLYMYSVMQFGIYCA